MGTLKRLVRYVKELSYDNQNYNLLSSIDIFGNTNKEGINPFKKINPITREIDLRDELVGHKIIIFSTYFNEMFFAYAAGKKKLYLDSKYWVTIKQNIEEKDKLYFSTIYNDFTNIYSSSKPQLSSIAGLLLPITFEQMELQLTFTSSYVRFFKIYGNNEKVNNIFKEKKGIELKKFIALIWIIFAHLNLKEKYISHTLTKDSFLSYLSSTIITNEEASIFLGLISLTRKEFKEKYFALRQKEDGSWFDYSERESFEKGLPKVSYFYPLINNEDGTYSLISHTGYKEFFKLRGLYRMMTEEFSDINFKSEYSGPLFEKYTRLLVNRYECEFSIGGVIGGNETYNPTRNKKFDEPDTLYDTSDYLLAIECKSTPFALNLLQNRDFESLNRIKDDIEKSIKNIDRYTSYKYPSGITKRVIKILVYYDAPFMTLSVLLDDIRKYVTVSDFYIIDIETLELLLLEKLDSLPEILDEYRKNYYKARKGDLNSYLRGQVNMEYYDRESNKIMNELVEKEMGLSRK
jgi:hypothetical protein